MKKGSGNKLFLQFIYYFWQGLWWFFDKNAGNSHVIKKLEIVWRKRKILVKPNHQAGIILPVASSMAGVLG